MIQRMKSDSRQKFLIRMMNNKLREADAESPASTSRISLPHDIRWFPLLTHFITLYAVGHYIGHDGIAEAAFVLIHKMCFILYPLDFLNNRFSPPHKRKKFPKCLEVRNNMPIFALRNPPRVENTEARPPLKRWAYFFNGLKQTRYGQAEGYCICRRLQFLYILACLYPFIYNY